MSEDFELDPDFDLEAEFGEIEDELDAFDDFDVVNQDVVFRTAVLQKDSMVALLCIKSANVGAAICRVDPRENLPAVQLYDDPQAALHWFTRSLRSSKANGWTIVYDGLPLQG